MKYFVIVHYKRANSDKQKTRHHGFCSLESVEEFVKTMRNSKDFQDVQILIYELKKTCTD